MHKYACSLFSFLSGTHMLFFIFSLKDGPDVVLCFYQNKIVLTVLIQTCLVSCSPVHMTDQSTVVANASQDNVKVTTEEQVKLP